MQYLRLQCSQTQIGSTPPWFPWGAQLPMEVPTELWHRTLSKSRTESQPMNTSDLQADCLSKSPMLNLTSMVTWILLAPPTERSGQPSAWSNTTSEGTGQIPLCSSTWTLGQPLGVGLEGGYYPNHQEPWFPIELPPHHYEPPSLSTQPPSLKSLPDPDSHHPILIQRISAQTNQSTKQSTYDGDRLNAYKIRCGVLSLDTVQHDEERYGIQNNDLCRRRDWHHQGIVKKECQKWSS
jgi:hypothetical protein